MLPLLKSGEPCQRSGQLASFYRGEIPRQNFGAWSQFSNAWEGKRSPDASASHRSGAWAVWPLGLNPKPKTSCKQTAQSLSASAGHGFARFQSNQWASTGIMEKLSVGWQMSTRWTDPPMMLMGIIPYAGVCATISGTYCWKAYQLLKGAGGDPESLKEIGLLLAGAAAPTVFTWTWWNVLYHGLGTDPRCLSVDPTAPEAPVRSGTGTFRAVTLQLGQLCPPSQTTEHLLHCTVSTHTSF